MIIQLSINSFRGVARALELDFARVTLLTGPNGLGKTTVFDAIDWCLFGRSWRLGDEGAIRNLYSPTSSPRVQLTLKLDRDYVVERDEYGVRLNGESVSDRELVYRFVRDPEVFGPYSRDTEARVRRLVYLPQAEIRELVKPAAESERVAILHSLLGVPNASVVEKSIRRIGERLGERERDFLERIEGVRVDIAETIASATGIYEHGGLEREQETQLAREVLGPEALGVQSIDGLWALAKASLERTQRQKSRLNELRAWLAETTQRQIALEASLGRAREEIVERDGSYRQESVTLGEARQRLDQARTTIRAVREKLNRVARDLDGARRMLSRLEALEEAEGVTTALAQEMATTEGELRHRRDEVAAGERNLDQLRGELARAKEDLDAWQADEARTHERADLDRQANAVKSELDSVRRQKAELDLRLQAAEEEVLSLRQRRQEAEERYRGVLSRMPATERLSALLAEVARMLTNVGSATCPLCGAVYQSGEELLQHVGQTATRREQQIEALMQISSEIKAAEDRIGQREADRLATRSAFSELSRREEELARSLRQLGARLVQLSGPAGMATSDRDGQAIQTTISAHERGIEDQTRRLNGLRGDVARLELRRGQLHSELVVRQARAADIRAELEGREAGQIRSSALHLIRELEAEQARAAAAVQAAEDQQRRAEAEVAAVELQVGQFEQDLSDARGREARDSERMRALHAEIAARVREVGIELTADVEAALLRVLEELEIQERKVRRVAIATESLIALQEQEERQARLLALRTRESELAAKLDEISTARGRFEAVAATIWERAELEAREALVHQTGAIQECLTALLPHRHLNRVVWDEATGAILLTDRLLTSAVRPDLYTSTGQMNVLALAVFVGVALLQRVTRLGLLALDEPIQNLDDLHFLAFVTLMKRVAGSRQVILSTADRNVAELIRRQMKSSWEAREYVQYEWRGFDAASGPDVVKIESPALGRREPAPTASRSG